MYINYGGVVNIANMNVKNIYIILTRFYLLRSVAASAVSLKGKRFIDS